ncbi:DDE_3 domain-containing protein [Trichonephila clavipes]|nr:DDE_3 domain-containing protein [Trichonephila clavipes]
MDSNARPHRANIVDECLQSEDIPRMDWPAYSPDLNPVEHVWYILGRRIAARQPLPTCLPELRRALLDEWCNIPQDQIDNLILSMPRRCSRQGSLERIIDSSPLTKAERKKLEKYNKFNIDLQALFAAVEHKQLDRARGILESTNVDVNRDERLSRLRPVRDFNPGPVAWK